MNNIFFSLDIFEKSDTSYCKTAAYLAMTKLSIVFFVQFDKMYVSYAPCRI